MDTEAGLFSYRAPENQEVVRVDFHDTDPLQYEQPLNVIPVATERNNLSVAEPMNGLTVQFFLRNRSSIIIYAGAINIKQSGTCFDRELFSLQKVSD